MCSLISGLNFASPSCYTVLTLLTEVPKATHGEGGTAQVADGRTDGREGESHATDILPLTRLRPRQGPRPKPALDSASALFPAQRGRCPDEREAK